MATDATQCAASLAPHSARHPAAPSQGDDRDSQRPPSTTRAAAPDAVVKDGARLSHGSSRQGAPYRPTRANRAVRNKYEGAPRLPAHPDAACTARVVPRRDAAADVVLSRLGLRAGLG